MVPYGRQSIDQADIDAVGRVLRGDWLTTGPECAARNQTRNLLDDVIAQRRPRNTRELGRLRLPWDHKAC